MLTKLDIDFAILTDIQCNQINHKISGRKIKIWSSKILKLQVLVILK